MRRPHRRATRPARPRRGRSTTRRPTTWRGCCGAIVGIELEVTRVEAKRKLSQNRSPPTSRGVVAASPPGALASSASPPRWPTSARHRRATDRPRPSDRDVAVAGISRARRRAPRRGGQAPRRRVARCGPPGGPTARRSWRPPRSASARATPTVLRPRIERLSGETWPLPNRWASPSRPSSIEQVDPELVEPADLPRRRGHRCAGCGSWRARRRSHSSSASTWRDRDVGDLVGGQRRPGSRRGSSARHRSSAASAAPSPAAMRPCSTPPRRGKRDAGHPPEPAEVGASTTSASSGGEPGDAALGRTATGRAARPVGGRRRRARCGRSSDVRLERHAVDEVRTSSRRARRRRRRRDRGGWGGDHRGASSVRSGQAGSVPTTIVPCDAETTCRTRETP